MIRRILGSMSSHKRFIVIAASAVAIASYFLPMQNIIGLGQAARITFVADNYGKFLTGQQYQEKQRQISAQREVLAGQQAIQMGYPTLLGSNDPAVKQYLGIPKTSKGADILAREGTNNYLIGDSKGSDIGGFLLQAKSTYNALLNKYPDASAKIVIFVNTANSDLGGGYHVNNGLLYQTFTNKLETVPGTNLPIHVVVNILPTKNK